MDSTTNLLVDRPKPRYPYPENFAYLSQISAAFRRVFFGFRHLSPPSETHSRHTQEAQGKDYRAARKHAQQAPHLAKVLEGLVELQERQTAALEVIAQDAARRE